MEAINHRVNSYIESWMGPRGKTKTELYNSLFFVMCSWIL